MTESRRVFLRAAAAGLLGGAGLGLANAGCSTATRKQPDPIFKTRGVVLLAEDLTLADWPERAKRAGLTTIALHHQSSPAAISDFIRSPPGQRFLESCRRLGLEVEYELHAMKELLPRDLFVKEPLLFRRNDAGERTPDANLCVHSQPALEIVAENARVLAESLRPTTGRYFLWGDDGEPWCRCPRCRELSDSDQALSLANWLREVLRGKDPRAQVAHLAYANTLSPPTQVRPAPGVFLEYAPIHRRYDLPYSLQTKPPDRDGLHLLDANLRLFRPETAQMLEYWLDVSRFSKWKRPAVQLPWNKEIFLADVAAYKARGIRHLTTFAAWVDADYMARFGEPTFIAEYGAGLD